MKGLIITLDLDWAPEPAIEETLDFFQKRKINPTVFITHRSSRVEACLSELEVGLHPYFDSESSHGSTINQVVDYVMALPHNCPVFRCHRFKTCNQSKQAMAEAGMRISSNVCSDLEVISPFRDRFGFLEVPIFMEDGGYLWHKHSLEVDDSLRKRLLQEGVKVFVIHPMHFALNTPVFDYMVKIKKITSREDWNTMTKQKLNALKWKGRGIRDLILDMVEEVEHLPFLNMRSFLVSLQQ